MYVTTAINNEFIISKHDFSVENFIKKLFSVQMDDKELIINVIKVLAL